jgi:nanoRNase/pAp phosphatase (c-di-AMP/oligoRNAs hydrolase)
MDNAVAQKIRDALAKSQSVGIIVAPDPSIDIMAAGLSLYLLLKEANKTVSIACPTEPIVELSSLVGIDKVQPGLGGEAGDLVVSFPYNDGEIDKVSYTIEDGYLNIIVKAGEKGISFDDQDIRYSKGSGPVDLLFVIGTPRLDEIQGVFDTENLRETRIINIDNKQENQGYGDIVAVSPRFSSVSEQIADLALALGMHIEHDTAQNLLSGLINGTKNFQSPNTSPLAFEMASFMMKKGANRARARSADDYDTNLQARTDSANNYDRREQRDEQRNQQPRQDRQDHNRHGRQ